MLLLQKTGFLLDIRELENMPPNNPDLNPADYSILEKNS